MNGFPESCRPRFEPVSVLGEGGFGRVFLALEPSLGRQVAIKVLTAIDDAASLERFRAEARATAALSHPGIVRVLDHGGDGELPWIAYEYVPGESLRSVLERGPLPVREALEAARQIADALLAAHEHGVVHRDVKPENVLALAGGLYKIIDFGIARWGGSSVRTKTGVIIGTPAYIAPEVIRGDAPGPSADIYALGVMTFELIAGRVPFSGKRPLDVIDSHLNREPPALATFRPDARPSTAALVQRLLAKEPLDRPRSMAAVRDALQRELAAPRPARTPEPARGRARLALAVTLILCAAVGLVATRPAPPRPVAIVSPSPEPRLTDALRAFGARARLDALSATWRRGHAPRGAGAATPRDWSAWLAGEWQQTASAFAEARADRAAAALRRDVEARNEPLSAKDIPAYEALHELADLLGFFRDAAGGAQARFDVLDCMPEPWRGRAPPGVADASVFALVAASGGKSGRLPGSEGSVASLELRPAWPTDDFQSAGYGLRRQAREGFAGTVLGARTAATVDRYAHPDPLPWQASRELELGVCVRGWEVRDAVEARFEPRGGGAAVTLVLGRWNRGRPDGYLRVDPALIPPDARLTLSLRPLPWRAGAGLNLEWFSARYQRASGDPVRDPGHQSPESRARSR